MTIEYGTDKSVQILILILFILHYQFKNKY